MNKLSKLVKKAIAQPSKVPTAILNRLRGFYKLYVTKDEFTVAVNKWFKDNGDELLRLDYPLTEESIVFDLGGYKGDFAYEINKKYGCYVYLYEPVKKFYEECVERFKGNTKIKCLNYGLSNENGNFFIGDNDDGSSIIRNNKSDNREQILIKDFIEEFKSLQIAGVDLLKINIEGPEFLILPHIISNNIIQCVEHIQVQFHDFYPNAIELRKEIRNSLSKTHIEKWNYPFVWESWSKTKLTQPQL
jgi:FkbM family methyltransferase